MQGEISLDQYTALILRRISTSRSMRMSLSICFRKRCFRSVLPQPATGQGAGPEEKMRSTHDSHIL